MIKFEHVSWFMCFLMRMCETVQNIEIRKFYTHCVLTQYRQVRLTL